MIETYTGNVTMLSFTDERISNPPDGHIVAFGTEDEIREVGRRVALGAKELDRRATRRKQQKASRRANR